VAPGPDGWQRVIGQDSAQVGDGSPARQGVAITNHSRREPLVMLKHSGPNQDEMPTTVPI